MACFGNAAPSPQVGWVCRQLHKVALYEYLQALEFLTSALATRLVPPSTSPSGSEVCAKDQHQQALREVLQETCAGVAAAPCPFAVLLVTLVGNYIPHSPLFSVFTTPPFI